MSINDSIAKFFNTPFVRGREFRTFKDLNIASAGVYTIRIVVPKNTILTGLDLVITSGDVKLETISGGTVGGSFAETLPRINTNLMAGTPAYSPTVVMTAGGTVTGGTVIDVVRVKADSNAARQTAVGNTTSDQRGIAAGTYFWRFTNATGDAVVGTFKARWQEP